MIINMNYAIPILIIVVIILVSAARKQNKVRLEYALAVNPVEEKLQEELKRQNLELDSYYRFVNDEKKAILIAGSADGGKVLIGTTEGIRTIRRSEIKECRTEMERAGDRIISLKVIIALSDSKEISYSFISMPMQAKSYTAVKLIGFSDQFLSIAGGEKS